MKESKKKNIEKENKLKSENVSLETIIQMTQIKDKNNHKENKLNKFNKSM